MGLFAAVKNFFCEEEPKKPGKYDYAGVPSVDAADLFPVSVASSPEAMRAFLDKKEVRDEIAKRAETELAAHAAEMKARLEQPQPTASTPKEAKPDWLAGVDDKL